ncbi:unnamed protein product, partial [Laminaria digitata]
DSPCRQAFSYDTFHIVRSEYQNVDTTACAYTYSIYRPQRRDPPVDAGPEHDERQGRTTPTYLVEEALLRYLPHDAYILAEPFPVLFPTARLHVPLLPLDH